MACAGTISWFDAGMGFGSRKASRTAQPPAGGQPELWPTMPAAGGVSGKADRMLAPRQPEGSPAGGAAGNPYSTETQKSGRLGSGTLGLGRVNVGAQVEPDWADVVRRCLSGDSPAWSELVRAHHRRVYALCYRFTGSGSDAEDLTQEVFLKVYGNLGTFDTARGSLQVWITTLTRNLLVDHFRRTRNLRITGSLDDGWDETGELRPVDRIEAKGPTQHDQATRRELEKMVQNALAQVSPELREAVILRDLQDMDYKEIAQVLGIPEGTVKSRISRGRAELARLLERNKREVM